MSDAVATGAPAAPAATQGGSTQPAPAARATDGRFLNKESNVGTQDAKPTESAVGQVEAEAKKEAYRLRAKLKIRGEVQDVDLGEDEIVREIQTGRFQASRAQKLEAELAQMKSLMDPEKADELLRKLGRDPDEFAKSRIQRLIEREQMSEEQLAAAQAQQELADARAELKAIKDRETETKQSTQLTALRERRMKAYSEAIDKTGWERTPETIFILAETESVLRDDLKRRGLSAFDYTPEDLAKAAQQRMDGWIGQYFKGLDARGLMKKLGPQRIQEILEATIQDHESASSVVPQRRQVDEPPVERGEKQRFLSAAEVERNLKAMINNGRK